MVCRSLIKLLMLAAQGANHWYHVILKEGKNREVRRLWQSQDMRVSRLTRVRYGSLVLPRDLKVGKKVELSLEEIKKLFSDVKLEWPESRDEMAKERSNKAKNLSIKQQRFGGGTQSDSARGSHARSSQKDSRNKNGQTGKGSGLRKDAKSVQSKVKKK